MFVGYGTLVNAGLVFVGSIVGLWLSSAIPERIRSSIMQGIGLFTLLLSLRLIAENRPELLKVFFLLVLGSLVGSILKLEERIKGLIRSDSARGFISASMLFTVGPMTIMGCILEGAKGDSTLILSKAFMDGIASVILASSFGKGVVLSAIYVLLFQGTITFLAYFYGDFVKEQSMANSLFIGGGLMAVNALKMLELRVGIKVINLLPAMLFALFV